MKEEQHKSEYSYLLALGSSLGLRRKNIKKAISTMEQRYARVGLVSSYLETAPEGGVAEKKFLNAACVVQSQLSPELFLREILAIERYMGRVRQEKWEDRLIDIDIILARGPNGQDFTADLSKLKIPHPLFRERLFVLIPAAEVAGEWTDPVSGLQILDLLDLRLRAQSLS